MSNTLYIFKYSAIDINGKEVHDFFIAQNLDECIMFLSVMGFKNINVVPLNVNEKKPDLNRPLSTKELASELLNFTEYLKSGIPMTNALMKVASESKENKNIYERLAYFTYKGNSLSIAMRKLGKVIPIDIIDATIKGEKAGDITAFLQPIMVKYTPVKKDSFFTKLSRLLNKKIEVSPKAKKREINTALPVEKTPLANDTTIKKTESATRKQLYPYKYQALDESGKKIIGYFDAESIDDCRHFLKQQGFENIKVEPKKSYDIEIVLDKRINTATLAFDLTQLSTYIKAGIPLVEGVSILSRQSKNPTAKMAYQKLVYDLLKGDSLSNAMMYQKDVFPKLLINMVKSAEMTGDLPTILDDMAEYYEDMEQTRKAMKSAMTYPVMVLLIAIGVSVFMLMFLVPQFVSLYESNGAELPGITKFVIALSTFFRTKYLLLIISVVSAVVGFILVYKNVYPFRRTVQMILMKTPSLGNIIIYNEVYNFTKTFASLLNHGVFITDSMEILSNITTNEIYKEIINDTLKNLSMGNTISTSFKGKWAFPIVAYHMLVTGENTGQLGLMMEKVSNHYKQLHKSMVDQLKSIIEPIMIIMVAGIVGLILLSIITPMFDIYNQIN